MQRHHEKRRDMARSILPAKSRERARKDLASIKRIHRRAVAQELRDLIGLADPAGDGASYEEWDERHAVARVADHEIRVVVTNRRGSDKLNPFIHWAVAVTADLPIEDRLAQLRSILPGGLIGDHAMSHLRRDPALRPAQDHDPLYLRRRQTGWADLERARQQAQRAAELGIIRHLLRVVVDTGGELTRFNQVMKTCDLHADREFCADAGCVRRCLAGAHDIDGFIGEVAAIAPKQKRRWSTPEGPEGLPARRLAHWLTSLRLAGAAARPLACRPSGGQFGS